MYKLSFREKVGLTSPLRLRLKQAKIALFGEEDVPRSTFGISSLQQLYPKVSPTLWLGKTYLKQTVIISNLFNHKQTPIEEGWSVAKTQTLDFRGKGLTYNSHNGTDFAIPTGTIVCTAAAGVVVAILNEFNRGGLKVFVDHGDGLMTCYAHLARTLVSEGDVLSRGQKIALSGYSGIDGFLTFPFGIPHIHFNVWLNGEPVDPFGYSNSPSMWSSGELPSGAPFSKGENRTISVFNKSKVEEAISKCKTWRSRERLNGYKSLHEKGTYTVIEMNYYPTRFNERINVYDRYYERKPILDLPFRKKDFNKIVFIDDL